MNERIKKRGREKVWKEREPSKNKKERINIKLEKKLERKGDKNRERSGNKDQKTTLLNNAKFSH